MQLIVSRDEHLVSSVSNDCLVCIETMYLTSSIHNVELVSSIRYKSNV